MEIRAVLVFKTQPRLSLYHAYDYVCVFKLVHYKGWWWKMVDILESRSSPNYEKRKVIAKGLARKYNLKIIYIKDRMLDVPTYDFSVTYKKTGLLYSVVV